MAHTPADPKDVALAALANMVRLMGAELTAGRHRDDVAMLEHAVRHKVASFTVVGCAPDVVDAGRDLALDHIERVLMDIRAQANAAQAQQTARAIPTSVKSRRNLRPQVVH